MGILIREKRATLGILTGYQIIRYARKCRKAEKIVTQLVTIWYFAIILQRPRRNCIEIS